MTAAIVTLARAFEAEGHPVAALVVRTDPDKQEIDEIVPTRRLASFTGKFRILEQTIFLLSSLLWLFRFRRQWDVVITVDTPPGIGLVPYIVNSFTKQQIRHIAWVLDLFRLESLRSRVVEKGAGLSALRDRVYLMIEKWSLRKAQSVVTIGECMRAVLAREMQVTSIAIPLMITPPDEPVSTTDDGHLFHGGFVGSRSAWEIVERGLELLEEPVTLDMTGAGATVDQMNRRRIGSVDVARHGFLQREEYTRLARGATIHIVSLAAHATGTSVPSRGYSAMSMGKAVVYVGDARGQLAADLAQAHAGWVVQTPTAFASAVREAVQAPHQAAMRGRNGREFIVEQRSPESLYPLWAQQLVNSPH